MVALLAAATSCDKYDIYPESFDTIFAIRDAGTRNIIVYSTDEISTVPFVVMKGGYDPSKSSAATLKAMDDDEFDSYKQNSGNTLYASIGRECYSFSSDENEPVYSVDFNFDSADKKYDHATLYIRPAKLKAWLENNSASLDGYTPCVPVTLTSTTDTVSSYNNVTLVCLDLNAPTLSMDVEGVVSRVVNKKKMGDGIYTPEGNISIPCSNRWGFKVNLKTGKDLLDAYNEANHTGYQLMPEEAYTMNTTATLAKGKTYAPLGLRIDLNKLTLNVTYAIAIKIDEDQPVVWDDSANTPGDALEINTDGIVVYTVRVVDAVVLKKIPLSASNVIAPDIAVGDGSLEALFDGKANTHFHSDYSGAAQRDETYGSYLQITLDKEMSIFRFDITNRESDATGGRIKKVHLFGTNDLNNWPTTPFAVIDDMNAAGKIDKSNAFAAFGTDEEPYICDQPVKYLRFCVMESGGGTLTEPSTRHWFAAELNLYGNY